MTVSRATQCYRRVQVNIDNLLRELSGPQPLHRDVDIISKPRIWNRGASAVSFETQPAFQTTGGGKGGNPTYFNPTLCQCHLDTKFPSFVDVRDVEVLMH